MQIDGLTFDAIKTLALHYPNNAHTATKSPLKDGKWLAYAANCEEMKRTKLACKRDLNDRVFRGVSFEGDHGKTVIGGKTFRLYRTKPETIIRDDFAEWIKVNGDKFIRKDGKEKLSTKPLHQDDVELPFANSGAYYKIIKGKMLDMPAFTGLMHSDSWNNEFDMEKKMQEYLAELQRDKKQGHYFGITHLMGVLLAAALNYRRRRYASAQDNFLLVAAIATKITEYIGEAHSKKEDK